jgi:hypothetical protein
MSRRKVLTPPVTADITTASERQFLKYINGTRATIPLVGRLFGRLLVLRECARQKGKFPLFFVECQCPKRKRFYVRGRQSAYWQNGPVADFPWNVGENLLHQKEK